MLRRILRCLLFAACPFLTFSASSLYGQALNESFQTTTTAAPAVAKPPFDAKQAQAHQAAWRRHLQLPQVQANFFGTKMVLIPPGEFLMGSSDDQIAAALKLADKLKIDDNTRKRIQDAERPQHHMVIAEPFLLAATEVTIAQFRQFVEATAYRTQAEELGTGNSADPEKANGKKRNGFDWRNPGFSQDKNAAVSQVTWNDAVVFCNWLSKQEQLPPSYRMDDKFGWLLVPNATGYRLPTEAEWEFAARAGTTTQFHSGDDPQALKKYGWFGFRSGSKPVRVVGSKLPNPFGLFDMHGNIGEWCQDFYDPTSYPKHYTFDSSCKSCGSRRVIRGGDWWGNVLRSRSAFRGYGDQITRSDDLGFRVARSQ